MKAKVDPETCIGCAMCEGTCPEVFVMEGDLAIVKADPVPPGVEETCQTAAEDCPVDAISVEE